jgi:hypothetical protein
MRLGDFPVTYNLYHGVRYAVNAIDIDKCTTSGTFNSQAAVQVLGQLAVATMAITVSGGQHGRATHLAHLAPCS